ncbi:MAG: type II toxin-antitoxin system RelE/ParE family toxin [Nitrospinae bacterium]|nr:type II toxin-antitoxin system RelE/ParE family toxin [Nitrospinota bacterium]
MSKYTASPTPRFSKHLKAIKRDAVLLSRLNRKMKEIREDPHHYKPLRNVLKNHFRVHVGSYVLIFEVRETEKTVVFHTFLHHDEAYTKE